MELLVYMGIFSIIFLFIMSSVFYLQKIIQNNNENYYVRNQIYSNLNILQQYLQKSRVELEGSNLKLFNKNNILVLTLEVTNGQPKNLYSSKSFDTFRYLHFEKYEIQLIDEGGMLQVDISWLDGRKKVQNLREYLIVINRNP